MNIPKDKQYHIAAGFIISLLTIWIDPVFSFCTVAVAGIGKELVWDWWLSKGTPESLDTAATIVPWFPVFIVWGLL